MKKTFFFTALFVLFPFFLGFTQAQHHAKTKKSITKANKVLPSQPPLQSPFFKTPVDLELKASHVLLMEMESGIVLLERRSKERMHPSSMTKIMTAYMIFDALKRKVIKPDTLFSVNQTAWKREGTSMFLNLGQQVSVIDLLRGIIIQSGNDASAVAAEGLSGSEQAFAAEMTRKAKSLGAHTTQFKNATGLPQDDHWTTAWDLAVLTQKTIQDFPQYYSFYKEKEFTYNNIRQGNRNPLLYRKEIQCDGVKTGHSKIAGYGMVASTLCEGTRYILVINGLPSMQARANESSAAFLWASGKFKRYSLFKARQPIVKVPVFYGEEDQESLTVEKDVSIFLPREFRKDIKVQILYPKILEAPARLGKTIGKIQISAPCFSKIIEIPLVIAQEVRKGSFGKCVVDAFKYLFKG